MAATKKARTKLDIKQKLEAKGVWSAVYEDRVDQLMIWRDQLSNLNKTVASLEPSEDTAELRIKCLREARQIDSHIKDALTWLGLKPEDVLSENVTDYDL